MRQLKEMIEAVDGDHVEIWISSSSSSTNFIATQVLKQNFRAFMCHILHYSYNVNAAVADSLRCRMICGTDIMFHPV